MYCKSCGKQIDDDSIFCSFCGTKQSLRLKPHAQLLDNKELPTSEPTIAYDNINIITSKFPYDVNHSLYDPNYEKDVDALGVGIFLLLISVIFVFIGPINFDSADSDTQFQAFNIIISLVLRISITTWVVNIAKKQNRDSFGWGIFAFFLPSIALIVIGTRKKLFVNIQLVEGLDNQQNSNILTNKAYDFFNNKKYFESIRFSEKAIELNSENELAREIFKKSKIAVSETNEIKAGIQTVFREMSDGKLLKIVSLYNHTIGSSVYLDDLPAPDGVYNYKSGTHKLIIENGKIKERYFIERTKNLVIEKSGEYEIKKGDKVYLNTGQPAPTGKYNMGFMASKLIIEDGIVLEYE